MTTLSLICNADELSRTKHCKVRVLISATFRVLDLPRSNVVSVFLQKQFYILITCEFSPTKDYSPKRQF